MRAEPTPATDQRNLPRAPKLSDLALLPGERGLLLGMTGTGKTSLADKLIDYDYRTYLRQDIVLFDTKPCYRAEKELTGLSTSWRYRHWDNEKGIMLPGSVVVAPDVGDPSSAIERAFAQKYRLVVVQVNERMYDRMPKSDQIGWMAQVMRWAYAHKKKGRYLRFIIDELNHWMYRNTSHADIVYEVSTSGRENRVGMLLGAQRPRNIGKSSIESMTTLYWFYTPLGEDVKDLWSMGVPKNTLPGADGSHAFRVFRRGAGKRLLLLCKLPPPGPHDRH